MKKKILCIIQARSGSKGIPNKNIYKINGHPLISYTIKAALDCKLIDRTIVWTDSPSYAKIARSYGSQVPFLRPKNLSGDKILSVTSLKVAVKKCEEYFNEKYDYIIELPCVSPLRNSEDIYEAIKILKKKKYSSSVISVVSTGEKHPIRLKKIINGKIEDISKEFPEPGQNSRRQDLNPKSFIRNGAIYLMKRETLMKFKSRSGKNSYAYIMPIERSINIDTFDDLELAEKIIKEGKCKNKPNRNKKISIEEIYISKKKIILVTCDLSFLQDIKQKIKDDFSLIYIQDSNFQQIKNIFKKYKIEGWICSPSPKYKIDHKILNYAKKLKLIVTPSTGSTHIDIKNCIKNKIKIITLKNSKIINSIKASSEYAFTLMLSTIRFLPNAIKVLENNEWRNKKVESHLRSFEFKNKNLCIIGFGRIGSNVAKYSKSLGFSIYSYDPYKKIKLNYVKQIDKLNKLLRIADILLVSVHLTNETKGMLNKKTFRYIKKNLILINISRGEIINEKSLLENLKSKKILAAGLDVISNEQKIDFKNNKLLKYAKNTDNLFITPHIAGLTVDSERKAANFAYNQLKKNLR